MAISRTDKILILGAGGFLGSHVVESLRARGYTNLVTVSGKKDTDAREQAQVRSLLERTKPDVVVHLAGLVGGILANKERPAEFFYENAAMGLFLIHESWKAGVKKFMGTIGGCSYPSTASSPIKEEALWDGYPQPESAPYSIAKKLMVEQAQAYRRQYGFNAVVLVPGNMYGPRDNFDLKNSHVIPALIRKVVEAQDAGAPSITMWGSGRAMRDFVYVQDVADILVHALETFDRPEIVNISSGVEVSIKDLTETVVRLVGYKGRVEWDTTKPEGQIRKGFAVERLKSMLGRTCPTSLEEGLRKTIDWYRAQSGAKAAAGRS